MPRFRLALLLLAAASLTARAADKPHFDDAALRAVHFIDDRVGWAVGDDGAIFTTIDAGAHWERQPSGTRASLRSVHFTSPYVGWVAGREELPAGGSAGVVLYTKDGGLEWRRLMVNSLPGLHLVRFVDERTGYLAGDGSEQFPSGLFATTDGGKSWAPVAGPRVPSWRAGDFTAEGGALAGAWNRLATVRQAHVHAIDMDSLGGRALCGLQLRGDGGIAVGQGGLVLLASKGRGAAWHYADLKLPREVASNWDFHAVGGAGKNIWAVGRPGSAALHSGDGGKTWQVQRTGQPMPLHGLFFRDERRGWAVGELGTILTTADGGKSWQVQKRGGQRLAALAAYARPASACLGTVAHVGAQDGYLTGALCVTAPEPASAALNRVGEPARFAGAVRQAGGAVGEGLWAFPVSSHLSKADRTELLAAWDKMHGDRAAHQLLAQMVLSIRMYRPEVVLTGEPAEGSEELLIEAMREAFRQAGDAKAFPEQITTLGLEAHAPKRLLAACAKGADAQVTLDLAAVAPRLGTTVREYATAPAALLGQPAPAAGRYYKVLEGSSAHRDLMGGLSLAMGGPARRDLAPPPELSAKELKAARARSNLWAIADAPPSALTSGDRLLAQVGPLLDEMPGEAGARVVHGLACQYVRKGQWALARETFAALAERYPSHPLAGQAIRWLLLHQGSSEARRRHELGQFVVVGESQVSVAGTQAPRKLGKEPLAAPQRKVERKAGDVPMTATQETRQLAYLNTPDDTRRWYDGCLALERKLAALGPLYVSDPAVQFCAAAARRQLGKHDEAAAFYRDFASRQPDGPWRACALAELWLANRTGAPPKPALVCQAADARPFLDGKLDDPCWQAAKAVPLADAAGQTKKPYATEARLTYDQDFLYLAVRCGHPKGGGAAAAAPRSRDADLRRHDRVSLMLDLDRDYATCFHLQVDARGCVADDCWGDVTWGPRWFVAIHREAEAWTLEAAIPRAALSGDHITPGKTWAFNVVRVLPGRGVQALSLPAEAPEEAVRPEGMGLLMFMRPAKEQARGK